MVKENYLLYVNQQKNLSAVPLKLEYGNENYSFTYSIPEKHLICGLIIDGKTIKGDRLKDFPFKPIEKYLFDYTNVWFKIPDHEFRQENEIINFTITDLQDTFPTSLFWEGDLIYTQGEVNTLKVNDIKATDFLNNFMSDYVFVNLSYDCLNWLKVDFFDHYFIETNTQKYHLRINEDSPLSLLINDYFNVIVSHQITSLPKYVYFSDETGKKTRVFEPALFYPY